MAETYVVDSPHRLKDADFEKPLAETRVHRFFKLENGVKVLAVSDPDCDKAACALNVKVGSLFDPREVPGLAHFCEHMLFMGTEKYPEEAEYNKFLQERGGGSNAFTSDCNTCYYFHVSPLHLEGALDRFAQFFVSPLFSTSCTDREMNAVDSEHRGNLQQDPRRMFQLTRHLSNPAHPFNHFGTGNIQTLRDECSVDVRQQLLEFHNRYYSANIMTLVVVGKEDVNTLEGLIRELFSHIKNKNVQIPEGDQIGGDQVPFRTSDLAKQVYVVPVRDFRGAEFQFILPEQTHLWRKKSTTYLSHLLGHEGRGSILSALKARGLATELNAGAMGVNQCGISVFSVCVLLTEKGATTEGIRLTGEVIFTYIRLLQTEELPDWLPEEVSQLASMRFKFLSRKEATSHCVSMSESLHDHPPEHVMSAGHLLYEYDASQIAEYAKMMNVDNMRLVITDKKFEADGTCTEVEPIYGTQYKAEPLLGVFRTAWTSLDDNNPINSELRLPIHNIFISTNFDLHRPRPPAGEYQKAPLTYPRSIPLPQSLKQNFEVFYKEDDRFYLPKGEIRVRITQPRVVASAEAFVAADLQIRAAMQSVNEYTYDALVAGLHHTVSMAMDSGLGSNDAIELTFVGYSERLPALARIISKALATPTIISPSDFSTARQILERDISATMLCPPYRQLSQRRNELLAVPFFSLAERLALVKAITYESWLKSVGGASLQEGADACRDVVLSDNCSPPPEPSSGLFHDAYVEVLVQGNFTEVDAQKIAEDLKICLGVSSEQDRSGFELPACCSLKGEACCAQLEGKPESTAAPSRIRCNFAGANRNDVNNALMLGIQVGICDHATGAMCMVLHNWLHQRFFDDLRTKQQLGYVVLASIGRVVNTSQLCFIVQSTRSPAKVAAEIQKFVKTHLSMIDNSSKSEVDDNEFDLHRQATVSRLAEEPKKLSEEAGRNFSEIAGHRYEFNRRLDQITFLESLTLERFRSFVSEKIIQAPWLLLEIHSAKHSVVDKEIPPEAYSWKKIANVQAWVANKRQMACDVCPPPRSLGAVIS